MATLNFQKQAAELLRRGEYVATEQFSNTLTQEIEAKRFILFRLPISEIERIRTERESAEIAADLFRTSKAIQSASELSLPPEVGNLFLGTVRITCAPAWESINRELRRLLCVDIDVSAEELCSLVFEASVKQERVGAKVVSAVEAAKRVSDGRRAESQFANGGHAASGQHFWRDSSSTAGANQGAQEGEKELPSWAWKPVAMPGERTRQERE